MSTGGANCSLSVISDNGSATKINYKCGAAGFGETEIEVITPRSLRISTQGISDQLPFNYVLQARRIGECTRNLLHPRLIKAPFNHFAVPMRRAGFGTLSSHRVKAR